MQSTSKLEIDPTQHELYDRIIQHTVGPVQSSPKTESEKTPENTTWWQAIRSRMDYIDMFIFGFLQLGVLGLLPAFILHILPPWTAAAFAFVACSALTGFIMMGLKPYTDYANQVAEEANSITTELTDLNFTLLNYEIGCLKQTNYDLEKTVDRHTYPNLTQKIQEHRRLNGVPDDPKSLQKSEQTAIKEAYTKLIMKKNSAEKALDDVQQRTWSQRAANTFLAFITLVGSIGMPFFVFLTINGVATPITVVPTLLHVTAAVVGLSTLYGLYKVGVFFDQINAADTARQVSHKALGTAEQTLEKTYIDFKATHAQQADFRTAIQEDNSIKTPISQHGTANFDILRVLQSPSPQQNGSGTSAQRELFPSQGEDVGRFTKVGGKG